MIKYKIVFDGEDVCNDGDYNIRLFDSYEEAEEWALYLVSCARTGAETLHMSNPGDYEYDEDIYEDPEFEIEEVEI